jgi:hypothetical protein
MAGLPVFYGSPVSAYAERHLDLIGLGYLVALSHRPGLNELACERYKYEFGRERVFTVPQSTETEHEKHQISGEAGGRLLFDGNVTLSNLMAMVTEGYTSRITEITGNYSFDDYRQQNPGAIVLFVVRKDGSLQWRVSGSDFRARAGWQVVALVSDENTDEKRKGHTSA